MNAYFHRTYDKAFTKLPRGLKERAIERIKLFSKEPYNPLLHNHKLKGGYEGCRSIDITGDCRAIFRMIDDHAALFIDIGTHSQLYS